MTKLTSLERVITTLNLKEPDRVPTFELIIDKKVRDAISPDISIEDFVDMMDLDAACYYDWQYDRYEPVDIEKGLIRDKFGVLKKWTTEVDPMPIEANIKSAKDLESYIPPDPGPNKAPWKYEPIEKAVRRFKGKRAVIASVVDVFYVVNEMLGMANHLTNMIRNPDLIDRLNEIVLNYNLGFIRNCIKIGVDIIWVTGDFAGNSGPLASPKHMERFAIAPLKAQVDECKKHGIPCLKHTDGNIWPIFDQLVNTGIAGIHPIDPGAGMDIGEAKERYGHRVCLLGNIDCGALLTMGTEEEVRQSVRECLHKAGKGGGLICMSSNSIHSGVPARNYLAMLKAIRDFGKYPLLF